MKRPDPIRTAGAIAAERDRSVLGGVLAGAVILLLAVLHPVEIPTLRSWRTNLDLFDGGRLLLRGAAGKGIEVEIRLPLAAA